MRRYKFLACWRFVRGLLQPAVVELSDGLGNHSAGTARLAAASDDARGGPIIKIEIPVIP